MLHPEILSLSRAFTGAGISYWLIGGNAVELLCGGNVRDHDDIDFLVSAADGLAATQLLESLGFRHVHGSLEVGNVFYKRDDLLIDLVPIQEQPPRTLGELSALMWPADLLTPHFVQMQEHPVRTLTPAMHARMKSIVAAFYGSGLREKDQTDLAALATLLT